MIKSSLLPLTLAGSLLALSGCVRSLPPLERYRLVPMGPAAATGSGAPARPVARHETPAAALATIRVEPYVTEGIYADPQIVYRIGESRYGAYPNREWALPLSTMLADMTAEVLRATPGMRLRVTGSAEGGRPDFIWRGAVHRFEEVNRGEQVLTAVHLEGSLLRASDDSLLWQGIARGERPVTGETMEAVVAALSRLGADAVRSMVRDAVPAIRPP
ncbi:MAG TPA: ABC-type transport auxiliary lipoprotein family protein [Gemmatimonadales bacterium]|nr:ABC-type transport auxiliary lipoprotein family protein [Gemmatimonadales bacterium]